MSVSWGLNEKSYGISNINAEYAILQKMAAQGQTVYAAAGDSGAFDAGGDKVLAVDDPASQPYVTGQ